VEELVDARLERHPPCGTLQEASVRPGGVLDLRCCLPDDLGGLAVDLEVLVTAEEQVVQPARAGDGRVDTRWNIATCSHQPSTDNACPADGVSHSRTRSASGW